MDCKGKYVFFSLFKRIYFNVAAFKQSQEQHVITKTMLE